MISLRELWNVSEPVLEHVHPELGKRVISLIAGAYQQGLYFGAFMGLRTYAQQDDLYAKGRTVAPIGRKYQVTNAKAGQSSHNFGLAVDLVEDGNPDNAGIQWSWKNNVDYVKLGKLVRIYGLEWGGLWKSFVDYPHVTLTLGMSMTIAQSLYSQDGIHAVWSEINKRLVANDPIGSGW